MHLSSVNIGQPQALQIGRRQASSSILKQPVSSPVKVGELGLDGDTQVNQKYHGGPDQAVYLYAWDDYLWWQRELGREFPPGRFGENLTVDSFGGEPLRIGDHFSIGAVVLEITAPRIPCATLAASLEIPTLVKQFIAAERPGCYARVLQGGTLQSGQPVIHESRGGVSLLEVFRLINNPKADLATVRALLRSPLAHRIRKALEIRLG